jgi:hypothetical protein
MPAPIVIHVVDSKRLPDNGVWINRFKYTSLSSGSDHTIAQNRYSRGWGCSCQGWRTHRKCKHLKALGLPNGEAPCEATLVTEQNFSGIIAQIRSNSPKKQNSKPASAPAKPVATPTKPKRAISFDDDF